MPRKRLEENATAVAPAASTGMLDGTVAVQAPAAPPAVHRPKDRTKDRPPAPVVRDSMAALTARLGSPTFWENNARFEWAKAPNNHHYEFTRFYFHELVLVDVWKSSNPSDKKAAEHKRKCVDAENTKRVAMGEKPIGLIAVVRGAIIPDEYFSRVLAGETFDLIERSTEGVLV
ncbi:MAG TPA: hypothetical protein VGG51_04135 [Candidatus Cybelea sp.]|jgi:hypothetical protein